MANSGDFKGKVKETIESITDFSQGACKTVGGKAKTLARRAKLTADITKERTVIRRNHIEIGMKYYDGNKNKPSKALENNCKAITEALEKIDKMENELKDLSF